MTPLQRAQFNRMRNALLEIAKDYQTPAQMRREVKLAGIPESFEEHLEMAYENIQASASAAVRGVKEMKEPKP